MTRATHGPQTAHFGPHRVSSTKPGNFGDIHHQTSSDLASSSSAREVVQGEKKNVVSYRRAGQNGQHALRGPAHTILRPVNGPKCSHANARVKLIGASTDSGGMALQMYLHASSKTHTIGLGLTSLPSSSSASPGASNNSPPESTRSCSADFSAIATPGNPAVLQPRAPPVLTLRFLPITCSVSDTVPRADASNARARDVHLCSRQ